MTNKAREVLEDCYVASRLLENEADFNNWKVIWIGAITLLRSVGQVLKKIDGQDPVVLDVSNTFYKDWKTNPNHKIFHDFIKSERDNLLKEYESSVDAADVFLFTAGTEQYVVDDNIYRPFSYGAWEGEDSRDVYKLAIAWWENELDKIDIEVKYRKSL